VARIAVVGVGAIGGAVAAKLIAPGAHDVLLRARCRTGVTLAAPGRAGDSMLYDRRAGRRLESDARNGAVVRIGARHGIATPLNAAVCALLEASVDSAAGGER
jgi:ketopantoate reductase